MQNVRVIAKGRVSVYLIVIIRNKLQSFPLPFIDIIKAVASQINVCNIVCFVGEFVLACHLWILWVVFHSVPVKRNCVVESAIEQSVCVEWFLYLFYLFSLFLS